LLDKSFIESFIPPHPITFNWIVPDGSKWNFSNTLKIERKKTERIRSIYFREYIKAKPLGVDYVTFSVPSPNSGGETIYHKPEFLAHMLAQYFFWIKEYEVGEQNNSKCDVEISQIKSITIHLRGFNIDKTSRLSNNNYEYLIKTLMNYIHDNTIPTKNRKISKISGITNTSLRYTLGLINNVITGSKRKDDNLLKMLKSLFSQLDKMSYNTFKTKTSDKPPNYPT